MEITRIGFAFSSGIAVAFNPCSVAILPSYISFIFADLTKEENLFPKTGGFFRGLAAGLTMSLGFLVLFLPLGISLYYFGRIIRAYLPFIEISIGLSLIILGVYMLFGGNLFINTLPLSSKLERLIDKKGFISIFLFGIIYSISALSCTFPIFIVALSQGLSTNFFNSLFSFLFFSLGIGLVVTIISIATFISRDFIAKKLNSLIPIVGNISAIIIILAGIYLEYYWISFLI